MRDLPTGTVTFLFTDIEGSTRLLGRLGATYRDIQEQHNAILRKAIEEGDGREIGTEGDSFFAVFPAAGGALLAAAQAQRGLAAATWPGQADVRVRMGIHTGEGILGGDNYLGLDVNRAARISAAAYGGQVLLSGSTRALGERSLPPGTRLMDLGQHRLKDLREPERLYQMVIEGLDQDFPPPRTQEGRPNNLPVQLTRFIGRAEEIAQIRELVAANRLVTLTGPGGTGKTRLSLEVAATALSAMPDGVFFIDLSSVMEPRMVASMIATTLNVRENPGRPVVETLADHLRDKELLLVLDNFEQVVEAGPDALEPLLRAAPKLKALVTSRVPLHLYGEHEFKVPPLILPDPDHLPDPRAVMEFDSVALFAERAAARRPQFRVGADNARTVAEITARLDGLPLAIELAASRMNLLSPESLLARLQQRLPLLRAEDRNVPERQRTLRRTIEWSYELLDEAERRMFSRLSVFAGGADLEAIEAVVNPDGELGIDILDGLASLVDKNLVRSVDTPDGEPRFAMLETIREYGLEQLSKSGDERLVRRRHAEHWIHVGERTSETLFGADRPAVSRRLEQDHENFRSALTWVLESDEPELGLRLGAALRDFWREGGHYTEGIRWFQSLLAAPGAAGKTLLRARALTGAADISSWIGEIAAYLRFAEEAVSIYRELADPAGIPADALEELGAAQMFNGQLSEARVSLSEARQLNIALGNRQKAGECTLALSILTLIEGRPEEARAPMEEALATFEDLGSAWYIAFAERNVGHLDRLEGSLDAAENRYRKSLSGLREVESALGVGWVVYGFADLALARGQYERAVRLAGASRAIRDREGEVWSFDYVFVGDVRERARAFLDEATAENLYREGLEMQFEEAVAYALQPEPS